jgi:hypothetical protein
MRRSLPDSGSKVPQWRAVTAIYPPDQSLVISLNGYRMLEEAGISASLDSSVALVGGAGWGF